MGARQATIKRRTAETDVRVGLDLDGTGEHEIMTGIGILDHMLSHVAVHSLFDLTLEASGDLEVDEHHTLEDVALCLGRALDEALGDRSGVTRTGHGLVPMDEALARVVVDLAGRPYAVIGVEFTAYRVGTMGTSLVQHFLETLAIHGRFNLHAHVLYGRDDHHKVEALFKALGQALRVAVTIDPRRKDVPSTKGTLTG